MQLIAIFVCLLVVMETVRTRALATFKIVIRIERLKINCTESFTNRCVQHEKNPTHRARRSQ